MVQVMIHELADVHDKCCVAVLEDVNEVDGMCGGYPSAG